MIKSPLTEARHDPAKLQTAIEAVKIFLDRAIETMYNNEGITDDDWAWFKGAVMVMNGMSKNDTTTKQ